MSTNHKLLALHQQLLYPALLGAVLFEFTQKLELGAPAFDPTSSLPKFLRLASALWFMVYFSVAFLALPETAARTARSGLFGKPAFAANLAEIFFILLVSLTVIETMRTGPLEYPAMFWGWLLIPITGGLSNYFSGRPVRCHLTGITILVGGTGLAWKYLSHWEIAQKYLHMAVWDVERYYLSVLFVMCLVLIGYLLVAFEHAPPRQLARQVACTRRDKAVAKARACGRAS